MDILRLEERIQNSILLGESQFREFKSCYEGALNKRKPRDPRSAAKDIVETLVAFANADGGELLIGVENDGEVSGLPYNEETVTKLLAAHKSGIHPDTVLVGVINHDLTVDDKRILYFAVEKSTTTFHHTSDGRCLQRRDTENIPVSAARLQFERDEQRSREYDRQFVDGADVSDLDMEVIKSVSQHVTQGMSNEKCLQYLGLAEYGIGMFRLRRAALLLFAKDISHWHPRCQVRIVRVRGTEIQTGRQYNVLSDITVNDNIVKLIGSSWDSLRPHLVQTKMTPEGIFREIVMYPEDACREALINAITHRNHALEGQNIQINIFDDRMEISSPGELLSTLRIDDLIKLKGLHESRNAFIARVLRTIGYVREMGEGMRRIFLLMQDADLVPPELLSEQNRFTVILRYRSVISDDDQQWLSGFKTLGLTREERTIALLGKTGRLLSPQQIYDRLNLVDWDVYRVIIEQMQTKGVIYNALSEAQKKAKAKQMRVSQRAVPRNVIRQPRECEAALTELFAAIHKAKPTAIISVEYVRTVLNLLPKENIYNTNAARLTRLFGLLGLMDDSRKPTILMKTIWGRQIARVDRIAEQQRKIPVRTSSKFKTELSKEISQKLNRKIFVGNVDYDTSPDELQELFSQCGTVKSVSIPRDYVTQKGRGFGFIAMSCREEAEAALQELDGRQFRGRTLRLDWDHVGNEPPSRDRNLHL